MSNGELREKPVDGERPPAVEIERGPKAEKMPETMVSPEAAAAEAEAAPAAPIAAPAAAPAAPSIEKDAYFLRIERILEDNLWTVFAAMPPEARERFKIKGEETAAKIRGLIEQTKVKAKAILQLIREWLKLIPGVNRFFLEQEAKIKTDKIMLVTEERKKEKEEQI